MINLSNNLWKQDKKLSHIAMNEQGLQDTALLERKLHAPTYAPIKVLSNDFVMLSFKLDIF